MTLAFAILTVQALLGAFDNLWHHELEARLPSRVSARRELALHSVREALYGVLFLALAWGEWHGAFALGLAAILAVEVAVTLADFIEEDMTRRLPKLERVAGRLLVNNFGTGVEVAHAMVHGGPFPATSDGRSTSVGSLAIDRFLRPVCYQDLPAALLPEALRDGNPLGLWRRTDGALGRG